MVIQTRTYVYFVRCEDGTLVRLGSISTQEKLSTEDERTKAGKALGIDGWNHVSCGVDRMYVDEGPGYKAGVVRFFAVNEKRKEMMLLLQSGADGGGVGVAPKKVGYKYVAPEVEDVEQGGEAPSGSNGEVGVADRLGLKTKKELLQMAGEYGKSSMNKETLVGIIMEHNLY